MRWINNTARIIFWYHHNIYIIKMEKRHCRVRVRTKDWNKFMVRWAMTVGSKPCRKNHHVRVVRHKKSVIVVWIKIFKYIIIPFVVIMVYMVGNKKRTFQNAVFYHQIWRCFKLTLDRISVQYVCIQSKTHKIVIIRFQEPFPPVHCYVSLPATAIHGR